MKVEKYPLSAPSPLCINYTLMGSIFMLIMLFTLSLSAQKKIKKSSIEHKHSQLNNYRLTYKIILAEKGTFGYDIFDNNRKMIHQPSVPGMPGNKGFKRKTDAAKVAQLVLHKINHNQMPPTVSKQELDSLKVKF